MLLLSIEGWANGLSAAIGFIFTFVLGLGIFIQARKIKLNLLGFMGLNIILAGLCWFGLTLDFFSILLTGNNLPNPGGWMGIFNLMWSPLALLVSLYIATELMIPSKKKHILIPFLILTIIFELFLFINPLSAFEFVYPIPPGSDLVIIRTVTFSPVILLLILFQIVGFFFFGFGFLVKAFKSIGVIRNKFVYLSIGYLIYGGIPIISSLLSRVGIDIPVAPSRLIMATSFIFFYFGLKEAPAEKKKKENYVKEVKVAESLFRLYERPEKITEEEVTFHREQKICLVCKGKVARVNYICPQCNALYCIKCSEDLSNRENVCWVCNEPLDESKPSKPFKAKIKSETEGKEP